MSKPEEKAARRTGRWQLLGIIAITVTPMVLAYVLYFSGWRSEHTVNRGELVQPVRPIEDATLLALDGKPLRLSELRGKWTLLYFGAAECGPACVANLYKMRQVQLAQGKNIERMQRAFIVTDMTKRDALRDTLKDYPGMVVAGASRETLARLARQFTLPAGSPLDNLHRIYLLDPFGNLVLSYPADADPSDIRKDLARLLRISRSG